VPEITPRPWRFDPFGERAIDELWTHAEAARHAGVKAWQLGATRSQTASLDAKPLPARGSTGFYGVLFSKRRSVG